MPTAIPANTTKAPIRLTGWRRFALDAAALLVYLSICHGASLTIGPLGRDHAALADPASLPWGVSHAIAWEMKTFGHHVAGYHAVNLLVLYLIMLMVYRITNSVVRGPAWLGTLAATLFMANPAHNESVWNLTGVSDLLPCGAGMLAAAVYAERAARPRNWNRLVGLPLMVCAAATFRENAWLAVFPVLHVACLGEKGRRPWKKTLAATACIAAASLVHVPDWMFQDMTWSGLFAPLYFVFYPIGFLPENAVLFHQKPFLGWLGAMAVLGILALLVRKAKHPAILFGLLAMVATQLSLGNRMVDPVHLIGGGRLLAATAFFNVAFAGLCLCMLRHPKWPRIVINVTSILCVAFFVLEIRSVMAWRTAGRIAADFRESAKTAEGPRTLLPDYRYRQGAPVCLSDAIAHDTPFGKAMPHAAPLQLHMPAKSKSLPRAVFVDETAYEVTVESADVPHVAPWPYFLATPGSVMDKADFRIEVRSGAPGSTVYRVISKKGPFPPLF
ncbi:MAG TPA: hypothetical protein P5318_11280 [Candidatus Hydrogenedentes bacterium]|mgnify:FL=1|nr:hypothetical protein [Candidatus Hydrogenedentota bacterium]HPC17789.1 hypothetical protein [Candidatus Hydrogenedentota bacterium]HRT20696.1 hypothetical protein [Candidatus Hydrogenedentota bacterium]HRT65732.1 hypothetical protein [Candidatus Hydrogenedentota bacterium]